VFGCWNCSPEKKAFRKIKNENLDKPELQDKLNEHLKTLDNNKLLELYSELNTVDRDYVNKYLINGAEAETKKTFTKMLEQKQKMEKVAYQASSQVVGHLSPVYAADQSVFTLLKLLHNLSRNTEHGVESDPNPAPELVAQESVAQESVPPELVAPKSVAVGGKSRRRSHRRRRANKKSRKGCKSQRSRHRVGH